MLLGFGLPQTRDATGLAPAQGEGTLGTHRSFLNRGPPSPSIFVLVAEVLPDLPPINARRLRTPPTTRARPTTISAQCSSVRPSSRPGARALALQESHLAIAINYCRVPSCCSSSVAVGRLCSTTTAIRAVHRGLSVLLLHLVARRRTAAQRLHCISVRAALHDNTVAACTQLAH